MPIYYINGEFVQEQDAMISARDLAVLRGFGAFDYLRTYNKKPFSLARNIERLRRSCDIIGLTYPWSDEEVTDLVMQTLERNIQHDTAVDARHNDYNIRIVMTGGESSDNVTPDGDAGLLIMVTPLYELPSEWYTDGVTVATVDIGRVFPTAKTTNYISAIVAQRKAREIGGVEALYVDEQGHVLEGTTTNLFVWMNNQWVTPPTGEILPGITRQTVTELLEKNATLSYQELTRDDVYNADEVFITAANKRIVPVVQIDDKQIADGKVGANTQVIMQQFDALTWGED